jgi:hypothetical protein
MNRDYIVECDDALDHWEDVLRMCDRVVDMFKIPLEKLELQIDPGATAENLGSSDLETWTLTLRSPDRNILLHELAHLHSREAHTREWAETYLAFVRLYLVDEEFDDAMRTATAMYDVVGEVVQFLAANEFIDEETRWTWGNRDKKVRKRSTGMIVTGKGTVRQHNDRREKARSKRKGNTST